MNDERENVSSTSFISMLKILIVVAELYGAKWYMLQKRALNGKYFIFLLGGGSSVAVAQKKWLAKGQATWVLI